MKKYLSLLLAIVLVITMFAGCGNNEDKTPDGGKDTATLVIGGIGPITGDAAVYGQAVKNGAELAVKEINAAGGINGVQIKFIYEDDEHDPEKSVNAYNTLIDQGMQILMGTVTSNPCKAVAEVAKEDNTFLLTPSGSAKDCIKYDNAFRVCFSDPNQGMASAKYIGEHGLATKVAVIYNSADVYSSGIYETFTAEAANQPFEIVSAEAFTSDSATDFNVQLQKANAAGAELVFLPIYAKEASLVLTQANGMGYAPMFFGCDGLDGILSTENFDTTLAEGVMLLTPFAADSTDPLTQKFVSAYKSSYDVGTMNQFAADAYDALYIIKAACEKANITPSMKNSEICEALKVAMTEITVDGVTGMGITWGADGEPSKDPKAIKIVNGVYTAM